ncbi:hypothetical protein ACFVJ5_13840 [Nocardia sp. NPDC127606]|uniref:hypothetical protein n=2 Tax=Nocardiaceae TaxID=85025 RepID=UPI001FDFB1A6|nr:hypothetical protein [Nocardia salmonicida]
MAMYLVFRLESETDQEVTYRFGGADHNLNRSLTINKADYSVKVADGKEDAMAVRTAGTAMTRHRQDGVWIKAGNFQA